MHLKPTYEPGAADAGNVPTFSLCLAPFLGRFRRSTRALNSGEKLTCGTIASSIASKLFLGGSFTLLPIPIIIVTFGNAEDVIECLNSLAKSNPEPAFDLYLCENGGDKAFAELCVRACDASRPCVPAAVPAPCRTDGFTAVEAFNLKHTRARVFIGNAGENLGYGGGVNRWLKPLREAGDWPGLLVLNPDTTVEPDALGALVRYARDHSKGMVTGRIVFADDPSRIHIRGLRWRGIFASAQAVGQFESAQSRPRSANIESQLDAPSGALVYVTRACLEKIGLMQERYFLYGEDLDWGLRAKQHCGIGYAFDCLVYHKSGTTIGTGHSSFSTYLFFRNRFLFVYDHFPSLFVWAVFVSLARLLQLAARGQSANIRAAMRGIFDGLLLRDGRPDDALRRYLLGRPAE